MVPIAVAANMNYIYMEVPSYSSGIPRLYKVSKIDLGPELLQFKTDKCDIVAFAAGSKGSPSQKNFSAIIPL